MGGTIPGLRHSFVTRAYENRSLCIDSNYRTGHLYSHWDFSIVASHYLETVVEKSWKITLGFLAASEDRAGPTHLRVCS